MAKKYWTFVVEGEGAFPLDMLWYDRCRPYQQGDTHWMLGNGRRSAMMVSSTKPPTPERWASFGWTVDMVKEHRQ